MNPAAAPDARLPNSEPGRPTDKEYAHLLAFRTEMRKFMRASDHLAQECGLTHLQHQALLAVRGHDDPRGPTMGEVADYLLLRPSSVAELVDRLQAGGFVERHRADNDARIVRLRLTERGEERLAHITPLVLAELRRVGPSFLEVLSDAVGSLESPPP